jgi:leucyl aminopeptidase (aminopeptidase T)
MRDIGPDLRKSATAAIKDCLNVSPDERVLVVTDTIRNDIGIPLYKAALDLGCDALMMEMKPRARSGEEPPRAVEHAMLHTDVFVLATSASLSHTEARKEACREGARGASIPIQNRDHDLVARTFARGGMTADYRAMGKNIDRIMDRLKHVREARVKTAKGTDITFTFEHRSWHADKGMALHQGDFTNLPGGEVYIAPFGAEGTVVIDGTFGDFGILKEPLRLTIKDGYVVTAKGGHADELKKVFDQLGHNARNVAELGIGMNPKATLCGILLEDEKVGNTIHVALGDNTGFGGDISVQFHFDGIVTEPRLYLDEEEIDLKDYVLGAMKSMA